MEKKADLRIEKTYLALHNAFTSLLEEKRFEEFTLTELCERAMIRRTTFYKHFADKYEYFMFYVKECCAQLQDQLPPDIAADNVNDYFLYMCRELLRFIDKHEALVKNIYSSNLFPVLMDSLTDQIAHDMVNAFQRLHTANQLTLRQMEDIAAFYSGGIVNLLRIASKSGEKINKEEFLASISVCLNQII